MRKITCGQKLIPISHSATDDKTMDSRLLLYLSQHMTRDKAYQSII